MVLNMFLNIINNIKKYINKKYTKYGMTHSIINMWC